MNFSTLLFFLGAILINELILAKYTPPKVFKVYDDLEVSNSKKITNKRSEEIDQTIENFKQIAINHLIKETGINQDELVVSDVLTDLKTVTIHLRQAFNGVIINGIAANVNIEKKDGNVLLFSSNLIPMKSSNDEESKLEKRNNIEFIYTTDSNDGIDINTAVNNFSKKFGFEISKNNLTIEPPKNKKQIGCNIVKGVDFTSKFNVCKRILLVEKDKLDYIYEISAMLNERFVVAEISSVTGEIYEVTDLTNNATFNAIPWYKQNINDGRKIFKNPEILTASPNGWNKIGNETFYSTQGNNVIAVTCWDYTVDIKEPKNVVKTSKENELIFDYEIDENASSAKANYEAIVSHVFYITNILHDFFYAYGFDEANGNYQNDNFGKGGLGDDRVIVLVQNNEDTNNASMSYSIDGYSPKLNLHIGTKYNNAITDYALSNEVITHEYTHGVSDRLIGGSSNLYCLEGAEQKSINEGFSDFFAVLLNVRKGDTGSKMFKFNDWLFTDSHNRSYIYTTDMLINASRISYFSHYNNVFATGYYFGGAIWCSILNEVMWSLIDEFGMTENVILDPNSSEDADIKLEPNANVPGNVRMVKIIIDGMKKMPCNPTFIEARDSIISAQKMMWEDDKTNCAVWRGFAKRGLGINYHVSDTEDDNGVFHNYVDSYDIPQYC